MAKNNTLDMTNGPFLRKIFKFSVPLIFTGLLQLVYNSADTAIVGKFAGSEALAAVGSTGSLINLIINVFIGLSMSSGVMAARYIGAEDKNRTEKCVHTAMTVGLLSGIIVAIFGYFFAEKMLELMNAPDDVIDLATVYLQIYFMGAPGSLVYNFGASLLRASGDTKRPLYILFASGIVNIVLNLILVIPFQMSVSGVAIATVVSQYMTAIIIVALLLKSKGVIKLEPKKLRINKVELLNIMRIGIPAGIQNSLFSVSNVIIQSAVNSFGSVAMAGIAAGSNFDSYVYTCTNAIGQTAMTFTSQNIGAGKHKNIGRIFGYCIVITTVMGFGLSMLGYFLREPIVGIFASEADVIAIGAQRLALIMPFYVLCSLQDVAGCAIRGFGKSLEPMIFSLIGVCGVRLLWIFAILPEGHSLIDIYWAYPISWGLTFIAQMGLYLLFKSKLNKNSSCIDARHSV